MNGIYHLEPEYAIFSGPGMSIRVVVKESCVVLCNKDKDGCVDVISMDNTQLAMLIDALRKMKSWREFNKVIKHDSNKAELVPTYTIHGMEDLTIQVGEDRDGVDCVEIRNVHAGNVIGSDTIIVDDHELDLLIRALEEMLIIRIKDKG